MINYIKIAAQRFTSFKMDIERHDFDTRRECKVKRERIGKSNFEHELLRIWGAEAPRQETKFRGDFWVSTFNP